jgi:hypothetical protein
MGSAPRVGRAVVIQKAQSIGLEEAGLEGMIP